MPTGYTAKLYEGEPQTFEEFVLECSRAFVALVELRDSPNAEIPDEFAPSTYHKDEGERARRELAEAKEMTIEQAERNAEAEYRAALKQWDDSQERTAGIRSRYEQMLEQAKAWQAPTAEHEGLKKFMVDQLTESIEFDCSVWPKPTRQAGSAYKSARIARREADVKYHDEHYAEDVERAQKRSDWVRAMRESLRIAA